MGDDQATRDDPIEERLARLEARVRELEGRLEVRSAGAAISASVGPAPAAVPAQATAPGAPNDAWVPAAQRQLAVDPQPAVQPQPAVSPLSAVAPPTRPAAWRAPDWVAPDPWWKSLLPDGFELPRLPTLPTSAT